MPNLIFENAYTFDDVLLVPAASAVLPKDVSLKTKIAHHIELYIPLLSAAMDTVTTSRLAIAMAQEGGVGIIHRNMKISDQVEEVRKVKKFESGMVKDPISVSPDVTVQHIIHLMQQYNISGVPVVKGKSLVGIVTSRDIRFERNLDLPITSIMTPKSKLVTVKEGATREQICHLLHQHRIEKLLVVNDDFELKGLITVKDIQKAYDKPFACKDASGQLRVGAAVGVVEAVEERVHALVEAGVDAIVVDTAHGHAKNAIQRMKWIKQHYPNVAVIGGNIATAEAALDLLKAKVDAIKVGIGPGSICTTRIVTGVGVPQLTAIHHVAQAVQKRVPVIADGGIRFSGDVCKALAAGADAVMLGGVFAGTEEAPGEMELYQGRTYKIYRGMGSLGAMMTGSSDRYFQDSTVSSEKLVPEGIEGRVPYKGSVQNIIFQLMGGLRSCMGYLGADTIYTLHQKARFVRVTPAGMRESHVHDVHITKQSPNYQVEDDVWN